jgi:hypothetical protein
MNLKQSAKYAQVFVVFISQKYMLFFNRTAGIEDVKFLFNRII